MDNVAFTGRKQRYKVRALSFPQIVPFSVEIRISMNSTITDLTLEIYNYKFQVVSEDYNFLQVYTKKFKY